MKKHWAVLYGVLMTAFFLTALIVSLSINNFRFRSFDPIKDGYILIKNDRHFKRYKFPGSGTIDDPYLIENYVLNPELSYNAITVEGTTKCFVIQNCTVTSKADGILLQSISTKGVIVRNNFIKDSYYGIKLFDTINIEIRDNLILKNYLIGLALANAPNTVVVNNTILYNKIGISMYRHLDLSHTTPPTPSKDCLIENNTCAYNYAHGISLYSGSDNCTVKNNVFAYNVLSGLSIDAPITGTIIDNSFLECGLFNIIPLDSDLSLTLTIENNSVNNKPLGIFVGIENENYTENMYGHLFFIDCFNIRVENQDISHASTAITIFYCSNVTIRKNACNYNFLSGIAIFNSENISIIDNTCNFSEALNEEDDLWFIIGGILIMSSDFVQIVNNTISNNTKGIYSLSSEIGLIENNTISNNHYAIFIDSDYVILVIKRNTFSANYNCITSNYNLLLVYNTFFENIGYAIDFNRMGCHGNIIHHNNFINNNLYGMDTGIAQALDNGRDNIWYDELASEGNYWSDWSGSGSYTIDGSANAVDPYPLSSPVIW